MKQIIAAIAALALAVSFTPRVLAAEITLKGEAVCAKCELHETAKCQTAIRVKNGDKTIVYYAENNDVAKKFHGNVCQGSAKVTAVGTVDEKDGKKVITLTKIDVQ
jgi:uncharacterized protein YpuA (DUF1002 family)